jgi:hypothetical protein
MYPAYPVLIELDNQGNEIYEQWTANPANLPEQIRLDTWYGYMILDKNADTTSYGTGTGDSVFLEGEVWAVYSNSVNGIRSEIVRIEQSHLNANNITIPFEDDYIVSWNDGGLQYDVMVIRYNYKSCEWVGYFSTAPGSNCQEGQVKLFMTDLGWEISAMALSQNPLIGGSCYAKADQKYPGITANTPLGVYDGGIMTVSSS